MADDVSGEIIIRPCEQSEEQTEMYFGVYYLFTIYTFCFVNMALEKGTDRKDVLIGLHKVVEMVCQIFEQPDGML